MEDSARSLHFRGPPRLLEALFLLPGEGKARKDAASAPAPLGAQDLSLSLSERSATSEWPVRVLRSHRSADQAAVHLRARLPSGTPPGTYKAHLKIGEREIPTSVEVEPHHELVCVPSSFRFVVQPGEASPFEISFVNQGNCPWKLRRAHAFGLFELGGVESAFAVIYRRPELRGTERIDAFGDELSLRHALVRVRLEKARTIEVNETVQVHGTLTWPEKMRRGHTYGGTWPLANLRISIRAELAGAAPDDVDAEAK